MNKLPYPIRRFILVLFVYPHVKRRGKRLEKRYHAVLNACWLKGYNEQNCVLRANWDYQHRTGIQMFNRLSDFKVR